MIKKENRYVSRRPEKDDDEFINYNTPQEDVEYLKELCKNVDDFYSSYNEHIERARNFLVFLYVDQWDISVRQARESLSKATMQFNKLVPIVRSILGEQRLNSPTLSVRAADANTPQELVDVYDGLLRQIQYECDADVVYQLALKQEVECGWGAARAYVDYESNDSFNQVIKIGECVDFQAIFWDPRAQKPDKSDGDYCGNYQLFSKEKYKKRFHGKPFPEAMPAEGDNYTLRWIVDDAALVCEIYKKEYFNKTVVEIWDGSKKRVISEDEAKEIMEMQEQFEKASENNIFLSNDFKVEITNKRVVTDYRIRHIIFAKNCILEETTYPGSILPIPYFEGDSTVIDGEKIPLPFVQDAIDEQRLINYLGSEIAYAFLRSRKETVIGTADHFAGFEDDWRNADQVKGPLVYNPGTGGPQDKPEFITPPVINPIFLQMYEAASRDLQSTLGWFEEAQGRETNAMSGIAQSQREVASKKPVNIYTDNNARGIKSLGKVMLDLIPKVYDSEREILIRGKDNSTKNVMINQRKGFRMLPNGEIEPQIANDMSKGKFLIEIEVDGSFDAQQQEAMDVLLKLCQINPQIANLVPDLLAETSGIKNSQKLIQRLKTLLPPQILAEEDGKPMPPPQEQKPNPEVMVQLQKNQLGFQQDQTKQKQLALDEQKIMQDGQIAGLEHQTSIAKAAAEVSKAHIDKDIALLNHGSGMISKTGTHNNRG